MNLQWHGFWYLLRRDCGQFRWEAPFFCTSAVLMRLDNGTIHGKFLQLSIKAQDTEDIIQDAILYPFAEAAVNSLPWAITLWQVAPWSTTASDHTILLTMVRLSFRGRPCLPVFSGGSRSTMRFHSSSVNSYRLNIMNTPFSLLYYKKGLGTNVLYNF